MADEGTARAWALWNKLQELSDYLWVHYEEGFVEFCERERLETEGEEALSAADKLQEDKYWEEEVEKYYCQVYGARPSFLDERESDSNRS
jgi:hypothetical protein